jgi:hypothetical protein
MKFMKPIKLIGSCDNENQYCRSFLKKLAIHFLNKVSIAFPMSPTITKTTNKITVPDTPSGIQKGVAEHSQ